MSRSPRSVWVEIVFAAACQQYTVCHAPHGACELKCSLIHECTHRKYGSRSPRSVWVEIINTYIAIRYKISHAPHGACELKFNHISSAGNNCIKSRSPRSVWVEMSAGISFINSSNVTLPTERVSWNLIVFIRNTVFVKSRSPRSVWVEIVNWWIFL